jgi:hypothetical protein
MKNNLLILLFIIWIIIFSISSAIFILLTKNSGGSVGLSIIFQAVQYLIIAIFAKIFISNKTNNE